MQSDSLDDPDKLAVTPSPFDDSIEQTQHNEDGSAMISDSLEKEVVNKSTKVDDESKVIDIVKSDNNTESTSKIIEETKSIERSVETPVSVDIEVMGTMENKTSLEISVDQEIDEYTDKSTTGPIRVEESSSKTIDIPITIERTSEENTAASDDSKIIESIEIPVSVDEFESGMYNLIKKIHKQQQNLRDLKYIYYIVLIISYSK